jgi:hypothetical protein
MNHSSSLAPTRRRRIVMTATALAFAAGSLAMAAPARAQAAGTIEGCASGDVCIYPQNAGWNEGRPSSHYTAYGAYNLSNEYGIHRIFNNQTGGAIMRTCTGYNGTGCASGLLQAGEYMDKDLTPINSIILEP